MAIGDIIVGIDIGTSKIAAVVGEVNNFNQIEIICSSSAKCSGIKKTKISIADIIITKLLHPRHSATGVFVCRGNYTEEGTRR